MTAEEIRDWYATTYDNEVIFYVLREIAAQLAVISESLQRIADADKNRNSQ